MDFRLSASERLLVAFEHESHVSIHLLLHHHRHYLCDDMSFRKSFSGFRKRVKGKLSKVGEKGENKQPNTVGEGFNHSALSLQSEPGIVAGGEFREGDVEVSGEGDPQPEDSPSISRSAVEVGHDQGGSDEDAHGGETSQNLHPHPHVQAESRFSRDVGGERADRTDLPPAQPGVGSGSTSIPPVSRAGETEST